ncbi:MAG TPA: hypothetical protein VF867_14205 [Arthrobacter sp.]
MSRAYKLSNAEPVIAEIEAARAVLSDIQTRAHALAASIGSGVTARFRRGFGNGTSEVVLGLQHGGKITAEGWVFVKTRDAVEPVRGAKGDAAREALAALDVPAVQPGSIVEATGMPQMFMHPGRIYTTQWMHHDCALYALLPDADDTFRNDPITGDWEAIRLSELYAADEARLDAGKLSTV